MPWESPIKLDYTPFWEQIVDAQENAIYKAVLKVNISVDREEMVKALKYDRRQYEKGYADGRADAVEQIIRCRDCKHRPIDNGGHNYGQEMEFPDEVCPCQIGDNWYSWMPKDDWYCADGERKENDEEEGTA